jgi:hypothetical protein
MNTRSALPDQLVQRSLRGIERVGVDALFQQCREHHRTALE